MWYFIEGYFESCAMGTRDTPASILQVWHIHINYGADNKDVSAAITGVYTHARGKWRLSLMSSALQPGRVYLLWRRTGIPRMYGDISNGAVGTDNRTNLQLLFLQWI